MIRKTNHFKIGLNILSNRLAILNGKINSIYLNDQLSTFKVKIKKMFINGTERSPIFASLVRGW